MLVGLIGVAIAGALIAFVKVHADALAEAQPSITELSPLAAATDVSVSGDVRVKFGRRPAGTPTLRLEPAHAVLEEAEQGYDLIVIGLGAEWGLEHRTFGMHSELIIRESPASLLIVCQHAAALAAESDAANVAAADPASRRASSSPG